MKMPVRILLAVLCAALIVALPFVVSSPNMLGSVQETLMDEGEDEIDFGRLLFSSAYAEEELEMTEEELDDEISLHPEWAIPLDFSTGSDPNPDGYTEDGYRDESIIVKMEHRELDAGTTANIAYIQISDPSQIRTAVATPDKIKTSKKPYTISYFAKTYKAVLAVNADNYNDEPKSKPLVYRMTQKVRNDIKSDKRDILIIDDQGDFHVTVHSKKAVEEIAANLKAEGRIVVNAYSFGPTLVKDGEVPDMNPDYQYNPNRKNPRTAIGQTGPLSYVVVVVETSDRDGKTGLSQPELAELMKELGCISAYNMDGGNSSEMVFGDKIYKGMPGGDERALNDALYFASIEQ